MFTAQIKFHYGCITSDTFHEHHFSTNHANILYFNAIKQNWFFKVHKTKMYILF